MHRAFLCTGLQGAVEGKTFESGTLQSNSRKSASRFSAGIARSLKQFQEKCIAVFRLELRGFKAVLDETMK
ncbi:MULTISPECIES: hypothetical protein [unclassified Sinorhizobium]|uniref:hypothetical protein n=1 Tax=unclassified Sinorhizobium TaxID=2613772 RepID=UPI0024C2EBA8|nr:MULTISPECIES: hypothetical protein [unclassified Sinorhizobium]MDK1378595.1 hypothetical protein [Sinorhizobium sp. 6-70]MDK1481408.1 hypothetical protein [Sinorhizobium sp. 6-117]